MVKAVYELQVRSFDTPITGLRREEVIVCVCVVCACTWFRFFRYHVASMGQIFIKDSDFVGSCVGG